MTDENSNPEAGEWSDDAAVEALARNREAQRTAEPEAEEPDQGTEVEETAEPEEADEEPQRFAVKVDGIEANVTLEELLNGYQRDADYRRKTQSLAEERRSIEAEKTRQKEITERLISEHQRLVGNDDKEPDWVMLAKEDPIGFIQQRAEWDARKAAREQARTRSEELVMQQRAEIARSEAEKLRAKVPEWSDPKTFSSDFAAIVKNAAADYGFDQNEITSVLDHRTLLVLKDAIAYRALKAGKPVVEKKVAAAPKSVVKPGSPTGKSELRAKEVEVAQARLKRSYSDDAAVAFLQAKRKT